MADFWNQQGEEYSTEQVEAVLGVAGVEIVTETSTNFLGYCPFHNNRSTAAFTIDKESGLWICFNPDCGAKGKLIQLLERTKGMNQFQARRVILKKAGETRQALTDRIRKNLTEPKEFERFSQTALDKLREDFWKSQVAQEYMMVERGFSPDTMEYFDIGYSDKMGMVTVPMHDVKGMPIGLIGRSPVEKKFKNSTGLPKSKTLFNIHRAKAYETVYVTEASYDGMSIFDVTQVPNFVSTLGGHVSPEHFEQLSRFFSTIVIVTDADAAGRKIGNNLVAGLSNKRVLWAVYDSTQIFPGSHKDANSVLQSSKDDLRTLLANPISTLEYEQTFASCVEPQKVIQ